MNQETLLCPLSVGFTSISSMRMAFVGVETREPRDARGFLAW